MTRQLWLLTGLSVLLSAWPLGAETPAALSKAHLQVERLGASRTAVTLDAPEITQSDAWIDYQRLVAFAIEGESPLPAEGRPTLPQVARFYQIPPRGTAHLELGTLEYDVIENVDALPLLLEAPAFEQLQRDAAVYGKDAWYPENVAVLSAPAIFRDLRVVQLTLYPVQVNPVTRQARVYRTLEAQVVTTEEPGENELLNPRPLSGAYVPLYRSLVANLDEALLSTATTAPGSYLILSTTNATVRPYADSLALWKTRKGFRAVVDARANWTVTSMQTAIQEAYNTWDPPLEYVCLMGDPAQSNFGVPADGSTYDHGFALLAGDDELEDIGVGRLSGTDGTQMAVINAKLMHYERTPYMADTTWFHKGFFYGGVSHSQPANWTLVQWAAQQFQRETGLTNNTVQWVDGHVVDTDVQFQFNSGISLFYWVGSWLSQMDNWLASSTEPGWRLPVCICATEGANNYSYGLGIAESYLVAGSVTMPRGGVAAIGTATSGVRNSVNRVFAGALVYAIANRQIEPLGFSMALAKTSLQATYGMTDSYATNHARWNNLMGDPALSVWTDVPDAMTVLHPPTLSIGARSMTLNVRRSADDTPVAGALVTLWKRGADSTWVRGLTDATGEVALPVFIRQSGELLVTVTKQNHQPYLGTVPCGESTAALMYSSFTIDDNSVGGTTGNGNGRLEGGEIIDLAVYILNSRTQPAHLVSATLASGNPRVTVLQSAAAYGDLAAGDSAVGSVPFRISASPLLQSGEAVELVLTVQSAAGTAAGTIFLTAGGANVTFNGQWLSGPLDPGATQTLTITLRNRGPFPLSTLTASLVSLSPFVTVPDAAGSYSPLASGGVQTNEFDSYTVSAHPLAYRGHLAPMRLVIQTAEGWSDTVQFTLTVGTRDTTDPVGPDAFGYYAYDNGDTAYGLHPAYDYLDISGGLGTNLNLVDNGVWDDISDPPTSIAQRLPFPFTFYGQVYDTITICSNGWCAFGNQAWNSTPDNYPIPAIRAPQAMIAPFWQELCTWPTGCGVWAYFQPDSHRYVIQWKAAPLRTTAPSCGDFAYDFEVMLYDTAFQPTTDGNGKVLVQYCRATTEGTIDDSYSGVPGVSIGIQDARGFAGLGYYGHVPGYAPGAAAIDSGRAILFTTQALQNVGMVAVAVFDAATHLALPGATVTLPDCDQTATTDSEGACYFTSVPVGFQTAEVTRRGYNPATQSGVSVTADQPALLQFDLLHPTLQVSPASLWISASSQPVDTTITIVNGGNGPLDYRVEALLPGDTNAAPWDSVGGIAVSTLTENVLTNGCEFARDSWWVSGSNGPGGQNVLYHFDRSGTLVGSIPQASAELGWNDLAWDGQRIYGSEGADLRGVDPDGVLPVDTIPGPLALCRALAYDPATEHFWVADLAEDIFEIDRAGTVIRQFPNEGATELHVTGLAWHAADSLGFTLYIFSQQSDGARRVTRMHPQSGQRLTVKVFPGAAGGAAGGFALTDQWNPLALVCGAMLLDVEETRLVLYELGFDRNRITLTPTTGEVAAGSPQHVTLYILPLPLGSYRFDVRVFSAVLDTFRVLPVSLDVVAGADAPVVSKPTRYRLHPNYPNPFNPLTTIAYELTSEAYTQLAVYNLLGERVAELVNTRQPAGAYQVVFDAAALPSGMYFYRLESGAFVQTRKMILLK